MQQLSQYFHKPTEINWNDAIKVLKYLKGSSLKGLFILIKTLQLLKSLHIVILTGQFVRPREDP